MGLYKQRKEANNLPTTIHQLTHYQTTKRSKDKKIEHLLQTRNYRLANNKSTERKETTRNSRNTTIYHHEQSSQNYCSNLRNDIRRQRRSPRKLPKNNCKTLRRQLLLH